MIKYITADLMQFTEDAFGHGCNCQKRMASGVAAAVRKHYFEMVEADTMNPLTAEQRLGTYGKVSLKNGKIGYNIYSQFWYGRDKVHVDYGALENGLTAACLNLKTDGKTTLALPTIGCGLAGGDWNIVEGIVKRVSETTGIDITIYKL
jgi:O-acetyl-ADP-ribose deacetylase (regulator of RNase III)